jgi:hypothetical protein
MRIVGEINRPECKITIFSWNSKYLIKLEKGPLEQTYKVNELDVTSDQDIPALLDETFISQCLQRFEEMYKHLMETMYRNL